MNTPMFSIASQSTIIAAGVNLFLTLYVLLKHRGWNRSLNRYFAVLSFSFALWNLGIAGGSASLIYIGVFMTPPAFYSFLSTLMRQFNRRERFFSLFLSAVSALLILGSVWVLNRPSVTQSVRNVVNIMVFVTAAPVFVWGVRSLGRRARLTRSLQERSRLVFILAGMTAAAFAGVAAGLSAIGYDLQSWTAIAGLFYTVSITIAIMRHRLFDIGRFASLFVVIVILALTSWSLFVVLGHFQIDGKPVSFLSVLAASFVLVMLYEPLKGFVHGQAFRVLSPEAGDFLDALESFGREMNHFLDEGTLIRAFARLLRDSKRIQSFAIYTVDISERSLILHDGDDIRWPPGSIIPLPQPLVAAMRSKRGPISRNQLRIELRGGLLKHLQEERIQQYRSLNRLRASEVFPFIFGDRFFGFVSIGLEDPETDLTRSEEDVLAGIARLFAAALGHIRLEAQNRMHEHLVTLGRLASGLAHEIRNPLATIKAAVQYMEPESTSPETMEFLSIIREEVDRLDRFVHRFLDYAKPSSPAANTRSLPLDHIINQWVRNFRTRPESQAIDLKIFSDPSAGNIMLGVDYWNQILSNLIGNALQAINGNGIIHVRTRFAPEKPTLEVSVEDNGPGIPETEWSMVFEPFFSKRDEGTGLGLAIVQQLIRRMNGDIFCGPSVLGGAGFFIRIPIEDVDQFKIDSAQP